MALLSSMTFTASSAAPNNYHQVIQGNIIKLSVCVSISILYLLDVKDLRWDHPFIRVSYGDHGFARGERSLMDPQYLVDESPYMMQPYSYEYRK